MANWTLKWIAVGALCAGVGGGLSTAAWAQPSGVAVAPQENILQFSASAETQVQQDVLVMTLSTSKEGADARVVQNQLQQALDAALTSAKKQAVEGQLDVRTGDFGLSPRQGKDGKITGWQGQTELVLEGKDFAKIAATAASINTLQISNVRFSLSREARDKVRGQVQAEAVQRFRAQAAELARQFGFSSFTLRDVSVNNNEFTPHMGMRAGMMAMAKEASSDAIGLEAGKSQVQVQISGSVQMR